MSSTRKPARTFRPAVEWLEDRTVPAGNIHAFVTGGILYVVGDNLDNQVAVAGMGKRSAAVVPLGDTTVNGQTGKVTFGDIWQYHVRLAGGNDDIVLVNVIALDSLNVDSEAGNDNVTLDGVVSRRVTFVGTGSGDDNLLVMNSDLRRRATIDQGAGDDRLSITGSRFSRDLFVGGGTGTNTLGQTGNAFHFSPIIRGYADRLTTALPSANPDQASVGQSEAVTIDVLGNDRAGAGTLDPSTLAVTTQPLNGTVTVNADGTLTYTNSSTGDTGTDTFRYTVRNSDGAVSNAATVTVTVTGTRPGVAPVATVSSTANNPTNLASIPFTVTFTEGVTGFTQSDLTVTNGIVSGFTATSASTYTFNVAPSADGVVSVIVPAGAATDSGGLTNAATDPFTISSIRTDAGMVDTIPDTSAVDFVPVGTEGLKVRDVTLGSGPAATTTSSVTVFYTGWLTDGTVFDSRRSSSGDPVTFSLPNTIQGFQQGLAGMKPGGIRQIFIPAALGYGASGSGSVPPNADLVFEVKMLAIA